MTTRAAGVYVNGGIEGEGRIGAAFRAEPVNAARDPTRRPFAALTAYITVNAAHLAEVRA